MPKESTSPVVSKMGILTQNFSKNMISNTTQYKSKIPEYAREYKREYQFIRGINKDLGYFINKIYKLKNGIFESKLADRIKFNIKRFLKGQEKVKLKDISNLKLPIDDFDNINDINNYFRACKLKWYDFYDNKKYYPAFIEIYDIFKLFFDQLKFDYGDDSDDESIIDLCYSDNENKNVNKNDVYVCDSDSDSDSDCGEDCFI